jgi:hypothetical protein
MLAAFRLDTPVPSPIKMMTFFARVAWATHEADRIKANVNVINFE